MPIAMSDATKVMTNIWRPEVDRAVPVLLVRNPYGKDNSELYVSPNFFAFLEAGYALAYQDCRGTSRSEGAFVPHRWEAQDGAETIEWLAQQTWCDGNVGMYSGSYMGMVQWQAAATGIPALKAIAPMITSADFYRAPWFSAGGAFSLECTLGWSLGMAIAECSRQLAAGTGDLSDLLCLVGWMGKDEWLRATPLADKPLVFKYLPWLADVFEHPSRDGFWEGSPSERVEQIATPGLSVAGWYDLFLGESLAAYVAVQQRGAAGAGGNQRLIVGPWSHMVRTGVFPDRQFGVMAMQEATQIASRHIGFFDRWLRGDEHALDGQAPVQIFVMGLDQWRDEQAWPLPDTRYVDYHLGGDGRANSCKGDGTLGVTPAVQEMADRYLYDPRHPVPTVGGHVLTGFSGPADQADVEVRDDVLVFSTAVLDEPLEVTGPVSASLFVSSSAVDTDFTAKLIDVFPDGRAILLCEGIQRMRYRDSLSEPRFMTPGERYEIAIDMAATSNVFLPGHHIRLEVSSSNFPRYDRNSNTGGSIFHEREQDMVAALNQVHRGPEHPSRLVLPIIDRPPV
ncbi:MAG TPA: CocE/NonD family hydrolase [Frankiaceae bacterium]|nr:CocE/NonD family hydrolase [Frankiaceae bacterium]